MTDFSRNQILEWQLGMAPSTTTECLLTRWIEAPILSELKHDLSASFCFVDGLVESSPDPAIGDIFEGPYYQWFTFSSEPTESDVTSMFDAFELLYEVIEEEGPFDCVMGFSQGASLAYLFLLYHALKHPLDPPYALFKYAVFFSGAALPDAWSIGCTEGDLRNMVLQIPSLHVCGEMDELLEHSLILLERCVKGATSVIMHKLGHEIPKDRATVHSIVKAIETLQYKAMIM
jgi:hypothetical protein